MKNNNEQKNIRTEEMYKHLLENLLKRFPLLLIESTRRDRNTSDLSFRRINVP